MQQAVLPHLQRKIQKGLPVLCQCRQTFLKNRWIVFFPNISLLTPNLPETEFLSGGKITDRKTREKAAEIIAKRWNCAVLSKGGHSEQNADDFLYEKAFKCPKKVWYPACRIDNPNTHGTGCTLSSAIAANLAKGFSIEESVKEAKDYISGAIGAMLNLGQGNGPLDHMWDL